MSDAVQEGKQVIKWFAERAKASDHMATLAEVGTYEHGYRIGVREAYSEAANMVSTMLNRIRECNDVVRCPYCDYDERETFTANYDRCLGCHSLIDPV